MKLKIPNSLRMGGIVVALKQLPWSTPLVQAWGLLGGVLVVAIAAQYVWPFTRGEKKNQAAIVSLLSTPNSWGTEWRPVPPFLSGGTEVESNLIGGGVADFRSLASEAASRARWEFVLPSVRNSINSLNRRVARISITWSGTTGGNAASLNWYYRQILGQQTGTSSTFVIGNGRRGRDGWIENTDRWPAEDHTGDYEISICLVGDTQNPTPAQQAALGELITAIEAHNGSTELTTRQAAPAALLAGLD